MNFPAPTAVLLLTLLLLLTPGLEAGASAIHERPPLSQRVSHGHRRFVQPQGWNPIHNGHNAQSSQGQQTYSKGIITRPYVPYKVPSNEERTPDLLLRPTVINYLMGILNSLPIKRSLKDTEAVRWKDVNRMGSYMTGDNEPRTIFFNSFQEWTTAFQSTLKRDAIYNFGKVGGIIILYYFFPGILSWITSTFGTV